MMGVAGLARHRRTKVAIHVESRREFFSRLNTGVVPWLRFSPEFAEKTAEIRHFLCATLLRFVRVAVDFCPATCAPAAHCAPLSFFPQFRGAAHGSPARSGQESARRGPDPMGSAPSTGMPSAIVALMRSHWREKQGAFSAPKTGQIVKCCSARRPHDSRPYPVHDADPHGRPVT